MKEKQTYLRLFQT